MQMASSASCTCMELTSASEYTATVRIFSSLQALIMRTAISPRLATRSFSNIAASGRAQFEEWLAELDRFGILHQDLCDEAFGFGLDLVHHLHRFDDADDRVG